MWKILQKDSRTLSIRSNLDCMKLLRLVKMYSSLVVLEENLDWKST